MTNLIDGRAFARQVHSESAARMADLARRGIQPGLLVIRVGEDPASQVYVGMMEKKAAELGIHSETVVLPQSTSEQSLLALIEDSNRNSRWHGILVQAPLPRGIDAARVFSQVDPRKDVDGFHPLNAGRLLLGEPGGFTPCTPGGVQELLVRSGTPIEGAEVVILGRGNIVGKPLASLLMQRGTRANGTVTIVHSASRDIESHCRRADILVAAMGAPEFVRASMVKPGAVVIDVGVNRLVDPVTGTSRLVGDVAFAEVQPIAGKITPNPGGVGPMTIAMLMANTIKAAELISI